MSGQNETHRLTGPMAVRKARRVLEGIDNTDEIIAVEISVTRRGE